MNNIVRVFTAVALLFLSGCGFGPDNVQLNPQATPTATTNIGNGQQVAVNVVDSRTETTIGTKRNGFGIPIDHISLAGDISQSVHDNIFSGLKAYDFTPVDYQANTNNSKVLNLKILNLHYRQVFGAVDFKLITTSTIKAQATNGRHTYDKVYNGVNERTSMIVPGSAKDSADVNAALNDSLNQILNDKALMEFLAK